MASIVSNQPSLHPLAEKQDIIGFDNLLVGRLPKILLDLLQPSLRNANRRGLTSDLWASKQFSEQLLLFTHRQWTYRNHVKHFKTPDGKSPSEHATIDDHVQSLLTLSPEQLPPHHRHLLTKTNFSKLGSSPSHVKQFWISEVQSALNEDAISTHHRASTIPSTPITIVRNRQRVQVANITAPLFPNKMNNSTSN